jgi:hypothetical protein
VRAGSRSKSIDIFFVDKRGYPLIDNSFKEMLKENAMKKQLVGMVLVCAMVLFGTGMSFAGQGSGAGDGTGPIHDILSGVPFQFEGDVTGIGQDGGLILSTSVEDVLLYGIGPIYYWESLGVARPEVGDTLIAIGFTVDYNGIEKNVVTSIIIDGTTVELRDLETGKPLWRKTNGAYAGSGSGNSGSTGGNAGSGGSGGSAASGGC